MDPVLLTTFGTLIVLLIFTVPIGVSIGTAVFMGMMVGGLPPVFLAQKMYSALDSFPLLAVPFFIVAGDIMQKGTIANSLLAVSRCLVGHIKGGMAHISILTSLFYGALSGSAAATVAAVGGIMIPAMEKEGYHTPLKPKDLILGYSGAHSSFMKTFKLVAQDCGVDLYHLIVETSKLDRKAPTEALMRQVAAQIKGAAK